MLEKGRRPVRFSISSVRLIDKSTKQGGDFNMEIKFKLDGLKFSFPNNWGFGFYMPTIFSPSAQGGVPIDMKVCRIRKGKGGRGEKFVFCHPLRRLDRNYAATWPIYSSGYTTVLMPTQKSRLFSGEYAILLSNIHQGFPRGYNAFPQGFFFLRKIARSKATILTPNNLVSPNIYQIESSGWASAGVSSTLEHLQKIWEDSMSIKKDDLAVKYGIVPTPYSIKELSEKKFHLKSPSDITFGSKVSNIDRILERYQQLVKGLSFSKTKAVGDAELIFDYLDSNPLPENKTAYQITVNPGGQIVIKGRNEASFFYALITLGQLIDRNGTIPALEIKDQPRFNYRGVMLDAARHFFTVQEIEKLMDLMALQKLNSLHLHLTDDEGFRIPTGGALTKQQEAIASSRGGLTPSGLPPYLLLQSSLDKTNYVNQDPKSGKLVKPVYPSAADNYQGSFTEKDINELKNYAKNLYITIIPEVDFPGHSRALIFSDPGTFIDWRDGSEYSTAQGYTKSLLPICRYNFGPGSSFAAKDSKFTDKINGIVSNVKKIFGTNEISLGGDEIPALGWTDDSSCTGDWVNLPSAIDKEEFFLSKLQQSTGIKASGWQEMILQGDDSIKKGIVIPPEKTGHIWVWNTTAGGIKDAQTLAQHHYPVVLVFADDSYFDISYTPEVWEPGFSWSTPFSDTESALKLALDSSKVLSGLNSMEKGSILGLEGTLWSENMPTFRALSYLALPKMTGLAEAAWAPEKATVEDGKINWRSLADRLGSGRRGFLAFLHRNTGLEYRGYPNGINKEIPLIKE